jgi:hypothetical protein
MAISKFESLNFGVITSTLSNEKKKRGKVKKNRRVDSLVRCRAQTMVHSIICAFGPSVCKLRSMMMIVSVQISS